MGGSTLGAARSRPLRSEEAGGKERNAVDTPHWLAFHIELHPNVKPGL